MQAHSKRKRDHYDDAGDAVDLCLDDGGDDRLSDLPDCLLHEIMSRMKAREVVQTCVLSRRWRHLWRSVPCLDVDQGEFTVGAAAARAAWDKFDEFAVILLRKVSIALLDTFRLHIAPISFYGDPSERIASGWIRREIKYGGTIPPREGLSSAPWRLKELHLSNVAQLDEVFAEHVRSGLPSLQHLELRNCTCEFRAINSDSLRTLVLARCESREFSEIASPTLKTLVIDDGGIRCPFVISAPAVAHLSMLVAPYAFHGGVAVHEMASIAKASITITTRFIGDYAKQLKGDLFKILRSVCSTTSLELLAESDVTVSGEESKTFPEFRNLRNLELDGCNLSSDLQVSGHVLRNSPNLEKLTLSPSCWKALCEGSFSYPLLNNMRVLVLDNYDPSNGLQPLQRLLRSSPALEKLTLRCCKSSNDTKKKEGGSKINKVEDYLIMDDFRCENLRLTEIIYRDDNVHQLLELLLRISRNLPNNYIRFAKV